MASNLREPLNSARSSASQPPSAGDEHNPLDLTALSNSKPALVALVAALSYLIAGIVGFHFLLDLTWAASFYFAVTTSLTVGYGDLDAWASMSRNTTSANDGTPYTPNDGAIIFTMLYIIGGMVVMGTSLGLLLQSLLEGSKKGPPGIAARYPLVTSSLLCVVVMIIGAIFIVVSEKESFIHGLYFAIVTMSTVGYGSGHPTEDGNRLFAAFYMLLGVACMGNFVGELADRPLRAHRRKLEEKVINQYGASLEENELWELAGSGQFKELDLRQAADRSVTRDAFCLVMLVRTEKLGADDLKRCQAAFDALDADASGTLDMDDVAAHRAAAAAGEV